jgi:SWI/SNF-related matrix-associated actin-dependent regulator of chromatin subfamily A member 5
MIQHGAEEIFSGQDSTVKNQSVEEIIAHGEAKTAELEAKFKDAGIDALQNFAVNSTMVWEGKDYTAQRKKIHHTWIEPPKRERKVNYSINDYYSAQIGGKGRGPRTKGSH